MKTEIKYRTFDELLNEVGTDFYIYNNENLIEPGQLIKVVQKVNYELGLRIHGTKEVLLDIENKKLRLPNDFYVLNYAMLCGKYEVVSDALRGRQTENVVLDTTPTCTSCSNLVENCCCEKTYTVECNTGESIHVMVVEKRQQDIRVYDEFEKLMISPVKSISPNDDRLGGYIKNGYIYTNLSKGKVFINYQGNLEDDNGNLLVVDHPVINEYYEYALKSRILENLFINGEDVVQKMQLIESRLRPARNNALSIVNTPDFAEMYSLWELNRKAMYGKYYNMFKSTQGY
jgi:hypothetical protein